MNKWYQSAPCKGILVILEHVFAVVTAVCLIWTLSYPAGGIRSAVLEKPKKSYADSKGFEEQFQNIADQIIWAEPQKDNFETDGIVDENKIVDIKEYTDKQTVSGENKNGLAYTLGDLVKWGETIGDASKGYEDIIVCKKPDETYQYFYLQQFRELVRNGELIFGKMAYAEENYAIKSDSEMVDALVDQWIDSSAFEDILDSQGNMLYSSCWVFDGQKFSEEAKPIGAGSLLEVMNSNAEWNGKLNEAITQITSAATTLASSLREWQNVVADWSEGNTNIAYLLVDLNNNKVYTNRAAYQNPAEWKKNVTDLKKLGKYVCVTPKLADFETNMDVSAERWRNVVKASAWTDNYICAFAVDTKYPIQDQFYQESKIYDQYAPAVRGIFVLGLVSGFMFLFVLIWLTIVAGRSNREEGVRLLALDKVKTELFLFLGGVLAAGALYLAGEVLRYVFGGRYYLTGSGSMVYSIVESSEILGIEELAMAGGAVAALCAAGLIIWLGLVRRTKAKTLWENSILKWLCGFVKTVLMHMNIVWKVVLAFGGFVLIHWITMAVWDPGIWFFTTVLVEAAAFVYLVGGAIGKYRIKKGIEAIAHGQVEYQIPLYGLKGDQREIAELINQIGDGLDRALEESMKNERLKTDLITNVSHDIKTPLTSIINYIELLKRENFEDPKIQNYLKVLEEKAQRLKTLTEDVVEASKVSSGNVNLEMMNLNLVELINQTSGEFEEKFEARDLQFILQMPNEPMVVYADGRRLWRVFANVFNNAAKYAMEHSRIYADLYQNDSEVIFTMKNVSERPLNITADELTERFIRGDISRSTEGSGLGLSIAKNLTELQGGRFELYLDGDLFKVMVRFPRVKVEEPEEVEETEEEIEN